MSRCASRKDVRQVRRERSSTRKPRRVRKKGGLARSFGLRRGQEDQRSQAAHPGRHVGSPVERCSSSRRRSRPRWSIPSVAPGTPTVPLHQAHLCRRWLCGREDGARRVAHRDMEAGDCEATRCHRFRDLVQKMDRRKDIRLDQPQSSPSPRFRTLRHNSCRVRPLGHDPHHAKAACCRKLLVMNPNLPDGLLEFLLATPENFAPENIETVALGLSLIFLTTIYLIRVLIDYSRLALSGHNASSVPPLRLANEVSKLLCRRRSVVPRVHMPTNPGRTFVYAILFLLSL